MSKTSASNEQFRNDTKYTDNTRQQISSQSIFPNSKQLSQPREPSKLHKNCLQGHKSHNQQLGSNPKSSSNKKQNSKASHRQDKDPRAVLTTICRSKHFHGTHYKRLPIPAKRQGLRAESARLDISPKVHCRKSSASISTRRSSFQGPKSKPNPFGSARKSCGKVDSKPSTVQSTATYICEKHQSLSKVIPKSALRLSAGDSHISEPEDDAKRANPPVDVVTNQATSQSKPEAIQSSHSIPLVLARKLKPGDDPKRIPAEAIHGASIHRRDYLRLRKQTSLVRETSKNPNNCNIKVMKFHNVEIIEQHYPQMKHEDKVMLKIIHKSRQLQQPQKRVDLVSDEDTELTKMMLEHMLDNWTIVVKIWKVEGYLQRDESYETVEFDVKQHQTPLAASRSSSSSSTKSLGSVELHRRSSIETVVEYEPQGQSERMRKMTRKYLAKKGPAYQETITTQLRYNYRRKKRFYPVHLMEHVLKYKRPPFWNYSRKYGGFSVLLNNYQLENLYELVPPQKM